MGGAKQSNAPWESVVLTTTNGRDAAGTAPGPYHRILLDTSTGPSLGATWFSDGTGSVSAINVYLARFSSNDTRLIDRNPVANGAWGVILPYRFLNTASVATIPDGVATRANLEIRDISGATLMLEFIVTVDIPNISLHYFNGGG